MVMEDSTQTATDKDLALKEVLAVNGKNEELFDTLLDKTITEDHVKKKMVYFDQKVKYPKSVFFIIINEFCERFCYYGMRGILAVYLNRVLGYSSTTATEIYHMFQSSAYFFPLLGAIIADSFIGKFKVIFYFSIVYAIGCITISCATIPYFGVSARFLTLLGLFLIALGTGGIKPCVSSFGGDQFVLPQQEIQLQRYFSIFYFAINCGSLSSTYLTPTIRYHFRCFGADSCYPLAFGLPAALMVVALVVFLAGRPLYTIKKPEGNILVKVSTCTVHAVVNRITKRGEKKAHWLDYAEDKYDKKLIGEIKVLMKLLLLYLPLPVFWALYDQQGSRWTFQAVNMDGYLGYFGNLKPEQMQIINPLLILILIPIFETVIYPVFGKLNLLKTPLQRMSAGGLLTALSFVVAAYLDIQVQDSYPILPSTGFGQLQMFNGKNCNVHIETNEPFLNTTVGPFQTLQIKSIELDFLKKLEFSMSTDDCPEKNTWKEYFLNFNSQDKVAITYFIKSGKQANDMSNEVFTSNVIDKSITGHPSLRLLFNVKKDAELCFTSKAGFKQELSLHSNSTTADILKFPAYTDTYEITINGDNYGEISLGSAGVYVLMIVEVDGKFVLQLTVIHNPNTVHMLWQIPQYVVITASEVMFSITGLEFSYAEAPTSMKSVLSAIWLLTTSLGNIVVVVIAFYKFSSRTVEFFTFAILMSVVMGIFMLMASQYKYVNIVDPSKKKTTTT